MYDNYYDDYRVKSQTRWYKSVNEKTMKAIVSIWDDTIDDDKDVECTFEFQRCPTCEGRGTHVNPSIDCNGITQEDFDSEPGFREEYFSGTYDVNCYHCQGKRVIPVCTDSKITEYLEKEAEELEEMERIYAAERSMGA